MLIDFLRASPSGNNTILVLSRVGDAMKIPLCEKLLSLYDCWAEQIGFILYSPEYDAVLEMSGGEFCGNASLALSAYIAELGKLNYGEITLKVSGSPKPVRTYIKKKDDFYFGRIEMPKPVELHPYETELFGKRIESFFIRFPGICHIVLDAANYDPAKTAEPEFIDFLYKISLELKAEALGLIFYESEKSSVLPLVFVRKVKTLFLEKSCASGTAALASYLAYKNGSFSDFVFQDGGVLKAEALFAEGKIKSLYIENKIRLFPKESLDFNL